MINKKRIFTGAAAGIALCFAGFLAFAIMRPDIISDQPVAIAKAEGLAPDSVEVTAPKTSIDINETLQLSALFKNSGSSEGVDQGVEWTVTNGMYYGNITSDGVLTAFKNGTINVRATSTNNSTMGSINIDVTGQKSDLTPVTVCTENLDIPAFNSALKNVTRYKVVNGVAFEYKNVFKCASDRSVNPMGPCKNSMYCIGVNTYDTPYIKVMTPTNKIAKVSYTSSISGPTRNDVEASDDVTWAGGFINASAPSQLSGSAFAYEFPLASAKNHVLVKITAGSVYLNSITFYYQGGEHDASSFADYVNGMQPDRDDVINVCSEGNFNFYKVAKDIYKVMSDGERLNFQSDSPAENVAKARARYEQWARVYGDATPYETTYSLSSNNVIAGVTANNSAMIIVISSIAVLSCICFAILAIKKRKQR